MTRTDRRKSTRLPMRVPISVIRGLAEDISGVDILTTDVSTNGMRIAVPAQCAPDVGAEMRFEMTFPRRGGYAARGTSIRGLAKVVHVATRQTGQAYVGVRFTRPLAMRTD